MKYEILFMGSGGLFVIGFICMVLGVQPTPYFAVAIGLQVIGFAVKYK